METVWSLSGDGTTNIYNPRRHMHQATNRRCRLQHQSQVFGMNRHLTRETCSLHKLRGVEILSWNRLGT